MFETNGDISLSDNPVAVSLRTTDNGIIVGNNNNTFAFIVNDYLNIDELVAGIELTSIDTINPSNYYSIVGHNFSSPQKGINIIRKKDGTAKKVWVK
ncbi:MAG: hypothetical protein K5899_01340 [Bacteroidaceae bacterium]|nr:hypothetical protein [Bacteroidaceae bacterium]